MTAQPIVIRRSVELVDVDTARHELAARVIAYGIPARVVDRPENSDSGEWDEYLEEFVPHAFTRQLAARDAWPNVQLTDRHGGPPVGYALEFTDNKTELVGRFRVLPRAWDDVSTMIDDGVTGVSGEFIPQATREARSGGLRLRRRTRAFLERVALEPVPAHADSRVLAIRSGDTPIATPHRDALASYMKERT